MSKDKELSAREKEVIDEILKGKSNKEIAWTLGISESTVKKHRRKILQKSDKKTIISFLADEQPPGFIRITRLSDRENEIMRQVFSGNTSKTIARQLNISYLTVLKHRENILRKMKCRSFNELAAKINAFIKSTQKQYVIGPIDI